MTASSPDYAQLRRAMVDNQLRTFSITDHAILARMEAVPREYFVPAGWEQVAYSDKALSCATGTTGVRRMLPPMIAARMMQAAEIEATDRILDVGGASGYSAAVLAGLGAEVVALESDETFARAARAGWDRAGIANVRAETGPLEAGFAAGAPYDVIFVNGAVEIDPAELLGQLKPGGRLAAIRRQANDPTGRAGKGVVYEKLGELVGVREVFDASAPVLPGFARIAAFAF